MTHASTELAPAGVASSTTAEWLSGTRVLVIGDSIVLQMAARVLTQFGAKTTAATFGTEDPSSYDLVLMDRIEGPGVLDGAEALGPADYIAFVQKHNRSVWVTASAFGLADTRAAATASEVTLLAAGGILGHTPGADGAPPTIPAGSLGLKLVGNVMAMAALYGLQEFRQTGKSVHVDLSAQASVIATGLALEMSHALANCPDLGGSARYGAPTGFFHCRNGSVYVLVLEQHQWAGFRSVLSPALDDIATLDDARERSDEVNAALSRWVATRTTQECEQTLQGAGVPCTTVNTVEDFVERAAGAGRPMDISGTSKALPATVQVYPLSEADARSDGSIPLRGLKVLDSGHVLAVPLAAAWLGAMGASVTKVEDPERLDVYRRRGPFASGIAGLNRSAYFNHLNFNKTAVDVVVSDDASNLDIEPYDVVLHNLSPHRAELLGVDPDGVAGTDSAKLQLASSGFGRTGAWSEYRAYGTTIHAFAGLIAATQDARGEMSGIGTPWADPLTSVAITTWVLAWSLASCKDATIAVDISMSECLATHLADQVGVRAEENYRPSAFGGDLFFRRAKTGRLLALSVESDEEASAYAQLAGVALPIPGRRGQQFDLPKSFDDLSDEDLQDRFHAAGLKASLVYDAHHLAQDRRLFDSGVFQVVESKTLGRYTVTGLPWSLVGQDKQGLTAAPERPEGR